MEVGLTDRLVCYFCNGGGTKEVSLAVTRVDSLNVKYICHRSSCGKRGSILVSGQGGEEHTQVATKKFVPNPYTGIVEDLQLEDLEYLDKKYEIDLNTVIQAGWMKAKGPGFGLLMPVFGPTGAFRGAMLRREFSDGKPKQVASYKQLDEPWICWYRTSHSQIVLVEDQISALKAAKFSTSVALLGTGLTTEKMDEILSVAKGKIWLALDRDAHRDTFDYLKRYRSYCNGNFQAYLLSKDIKNMPYKDIGNLLRVS